MYGKDEAKKIKETFWTSFGQYMSVIPSAEDQKINWVNYKTGIKQLYFRMDASNKSASVSIEITHPDEGIRALIVEQFESYAEMLSNELGEDWIWDREFYDDYGKPMSRIYTEINGVSIFKREDWPALISFFKPRIMALDRFWSAAQYGFELFK